MLFLFPHDVLLTARLGWLARQAEALERALVVITLTGERKSTRVGAFSSLFRLHGSRLDENGEDGNDNEVWSFGEEAYLILCNYMHMRERLRPYFRKVAKRTETDGLPMMRTLFLEFPEDEQCWQITDAYSFGSDLLVAPVIEPKVTSRQVHLPQGASWRYMWNDETFEGRQWVTVHAPLEHIPLFLRDDAELPIKG